MLLLVPEVLNLQKIYNPSEEWCVFCWVEILTEEVLVAHEQELTRLRSYYEQHKDVLEKVERWKKLWAQFLEFEVCCMFW